MVNSRGFAGNAEDEELMWLEKHIRRKMIKVFFRNHFTLIQIFYYLMQIAVLIDNRLSWDKQSWFVTPLALPIVER